MPAASVKPVFRIRIRADPGILTKSDPDTDPECEEKRTFFFKFNILFLDFDAALT